MSDFLPRGWWIIPVIILGMVVWAIAGIAFGIGYWMGSG